MKENPFLTDEPVEPFLDEVMAFLSIRREISVLAWSDVMSGVSFSYAPVVKAATENLECENRLLGDPTDGERILTEDTLLLFVLLTVPIRESVAGGKVDGLIGSRRGAGWCTPRLSDAMESRIPPSLLPAIDIGGVNGKVAALLNCNGCGTSGLRGDPGANVEGLNGEVGLLWSP